MSSSHPQHFQNRKQFQLERIILFSDAVFAIAITLLVLEIKLPAMSDTAGSREVIHALMHIIPDFIAFLISFVVIGQFWSSHHRLFGYISGYDGKLLWLNLMLLGFVAIMPFSTHLNMEQGGVDIVWFLYCFNMACIGLSLFLIWRYIGKKEGLSYMYDDRRFMRYARIRSMAVTIIFLITGLFTFFPWEWIKWGSRFLFFLIFPVLAMMRKRYEKTTPPGEQVAPADGHQ